MLRLAVDYQIDNLVLDCEELIIKNYIDFENIFVLLELKCLYLTKRIKDAIFDFIAQNFEKVASNNLWGGLLFTHEGIIHEFLERFLK